MLKSLFGGGENGRLKKIAKHQKKILNPYGQAADRQYYMDQLRAEGSPEAATALLQRFTVSSENSTVDRDEKELTYKMLVSMGKPALEPIKDYLKKSDSGINWPMKALRDMIPEEDLLAFIIDLLNEIGPEYVREPEKKEQLILSSVDYADHEALGEALLQFLDDDNETIRFVTANALRVREESAVAPALIERFGEEESHRVLNAIADTFVDNGWKLPEGTKVPSGFKVDASGVVTRDV